MLITPEDYDRSPLAEEERRAIEVTTSIKPHVGYSRELDSARKILARFYQPIADVYHLRHGERSTDRLSEIQLLLHRGMHYHQKMFWDWSLAEWMDIICPNIASFQERYHKRSTTRIAIIDVAYLLGGVSDLRPFGMWKNATESAILYFGAELIAQQCKKVTDVLAGKGFQGGNSSFLQLRQCLCMLFILSRSPLLEHISVEQLNELRVNSEASTNRPGTCRRIMIALEELHIHPPGPKEAISAPKSFDKHGMALEWYEWCMAWYERNVDLTPPQRLGYVRQILNIGRWLHQHFPEICTPEQWTEDLALHLRSDLSTWTNGQYGSSRGKQIVKAQEKSDFTLQAPGIYSYLNVLRRFFTDLSRRAHAVGGAPARRIRLDFTPSEVFETPKHVRQKLERSEPRDIDLRVWAKLAIAAATLSQGDLPQGTQYPLNFYRALGLIWVTSARRPNEIARLRLDCVREDWDPGMLDEDNHPVERIVSPISDGQGAQNETEKKIPKICYLHIPTGKNKGAFWVWIPDYTANAIEIWKRERPGYQQKLLDRKDEVYVDNLFSYKDHRVGIRFINKSLIPTLCAKAGIDTKDAKGKITGHRGRSTRLTLLRRNGVSLEDLAQYAGHANTRTIKKYIAEDTIQLHHIIKEADDLTRIIEGVIDMQAASQGLPAVRWFIGRDTDGQPVFCGNQVYVTCPHRLDCKRCGMFIGGEKARLLHEGVDTLPIQSQVPMTPVEKCLVGGDETGAEACRAALEDIPAPETSDIRLIFNPEGLSNHELEKLAQLASPEALDKLRQALDAHEKKLAEVQQIKTGRNAIVGAQKKRINLIQHLILECERRIADLLDGTQRMA